MTKAVWNVNEVQAQVHVSPGRDALLGLRQNATENCVRGLICRRHDRRLQVVRWRNAGRLDRALLVFTPVVVRLQKHAVVVEQGE